MDSRNSVGVERKIEHRLFLLSVWSKGIAGLFETIGGLLLLFIPQTGLNALVIFLTAPELAEDPTDRVATLLQRLVHELAADTKLFVSAYLLVHGLIKLFLVGGWKVVVVSAIALVPCRVHCLSVLSFHLHAFDLARAVDGFGFNRGVLDLA